MKPFCIRGALLGSAIVLTPWFAYGEGALPEGEGREAMLAACTACHGLANILNPHKPLSAQEWEFYLYDMVARGAPVYEEDLDAIRRYLVENFSSDR